MFPDPKEACVFARWTERRGNLAEILHRSIQGNEREQKYRRENRPVLEF